MSAPAQPNFEPITRKDQLVSYLADGCKPREKWLIGTEHEKFVFRCDDFRPLSYEGERGIGAVLAKLTSHGWQALEEEGKIIALSCDGANITLEPGGQLELSGAPLATLHQTCREVGEHLRQVKEAGDALGVAFLGMGFNPKWQRDDMPWMPKGRYAIMKRYMPTKGKLGLDMMLRTCTVQVNLDFSSESDMVRKYRVGLALQPIATALWANSPFVDGKDSGFLSYRSHVWTDTDPDRTGILPFVFDEGMGFERAVDYLLDVPMYFVYRDGKYIDLSGASFRQFMAGRLRQLPGQVPVMGDWIDHLTTVFPEVRLKQFLEMRGADGGPWRRLCALPAFWVGLLYDDAILDAAWETVRGWSLEDHRALRDNVPKMGLATPFRGRPLLDTAREIVSLSHAGLKARGCLDQHGRDESIYLGAIDEIIEAGRTPAEDMLELFYGRWMEEIDPVFQEFSY